MLLTPNRRRTHLARDYRPSLFQMRASPSGLTVTNRPGWLNMTFAASEEISLPNKQRRGPLPLAQVANSAGDGLWPRAAAQRRTMKPSIIFDSPLLLLDGSATNRIYRKSRRRLQDCAKRRLHEFWLLRSCLVLV